MEMRGMQKAVDSNSVEECVRYLNGPLAKVSTDMLSFLNDSRSNGERLIDGPGF
jgi:hypothetical protein